MTTANSLMPRTVFPVVMTVLALAGGSVQAQPAQSAPRTFDTFDGAAAGENPIDFFEVTEADVRAVCQHLSKVSGVDIVLSEKVKGRVTLRVTDKTWQEIFSIVCRVTGLSAIKENGYIYVMTQQEYIEEQKEGAEALQVAEKLGPLERKVIPLSNTTAGEMRGAISDLLSQRGKITVVEHNNALIVYDTRENIQQIREMVNQLDVETRQISIECKIIEVSSGRSRNLGVHWGFFDTEMGVEGSHFPAADVLGGSALGRLTYGILSPERFSVALEYLFKDNNGEVVAQPSITTLDNKEANIFMGKQVPVTFQDEAGNTNVQMIDAGTELTVTPHITGEGRIMLALNPQKRSYQLIQGNQPEISEQSAQTNVVVNDGETVVIAGLTSNEVQEAEGGVPVLKDIPIIGNIFKRSQKTQDKKDLIIFVTPHIIQRRLDRVSDGSAAATE
jgi:type II secretory pathway component HofQ